MFRDIFTYFILFVLVDSVWLNLMKGYYKTNLKKVQKEPSEIKHHYALVVYLVLSYSLYYFTKGVEKYSKRIEIAFIGGIITYSVYNFTNAATFSHWNIPLALTDTLWGGLVSVIVLTLKEKLFKLNL